MPRGGYRPGSGAKRGNTNAITTGVRSPRLEALKAAVRDLPEQLPDFAGNPDKAEYFGYYYRFIGEIILRGARGRLPDDFHNFSDRDALKFMLKRFKPDQPPKDIQP